jgi:hypothetical protein
MRASVTSVTSVVKKTLVELPTRHVVDAMSSRVSSVVA